MNLGIVAFPHKSIQDVINSYRKRYDPHYNLIPPHITLKEKFELNEEFLDATVEDLEIIAKETDPFTVRLTKACHFLPTSSTIYLAVDNQESLTKLHKRIKTVCSDLPQMYDYIPHLTIGQNMMEEELQDVYSNLHKEKFNLETKIDRFHLMYQLENKTWNVYQSFLFNR